MVRHRRSELASMSTLTSTLSKTISCDIVTYSVNCASELASVSTQYTMLRCCWQSTHTHTLYTTRTKNVVALSVLRIQNTCYSLTLTL